MDKVFIMLAAWSLIIVICAVVGFATIISSLMNVPIGAAAAGGCIFLFLVMPIVAFVEGMM